MKKRAAFPIYFGRTSDVFVHQHLISANNYFECVKVTRTAVFESTSFQC